VSIVAYFAKEIRGLGPANFLYADGEQHAVLLASVPLTGEPGLACAAWAS